MGPWPYTPVQGRQNVSKSGTVQNWGTGTVGGLPLTRSGPGLGSVMSSHQRELIGAFSPQNLTAGGSVFVELGWLLVPHKWCGVVYRKHTYTTLKCGRDLRLWRCPPVWFSASDPGSATKLLSSAEL